MRHNSKLTLIVVAASLTQTLACRMPLSPNAPAPTVPAAWLGTSDQSTDASAEISPIEEARLGAAFDQVLGAHHQILEGLSDPPASTHTNCVEQPWRLKGYVTSFAVTLGGVLGSLAGSGTAAAEAHWIRRDAPKSAETASAWRSDASQATRPSIHIQAIAMPQQLERQLEPSVRGALATGLIHNESRFRANVLDMAMQFQAAARALDGFELHGHPWAPGAFRVEMQFDANGDVLPVANVGGTVNFRFDWEKKKSNSVAALEANLDPPASRLAAKVRAFAATVSEDLAALDTAPDAIENQGMKLSEVRVSTGITVQGDVGFAHASTMLYGSLNFMPNETAAPSALSELQAPDDTHLLLTDLQVKTAAASAQSLVHIKRQSFRKGLIRAQRIGAFFARRAAGARRGKWGIRAIISSFDMAMSGSLGVATVGGFGLVELTYENPAL